MLELGRSFCHFGRKMSDDQLLLLVFAVHACSVLYSCNDPLPDVLLLNWCYFT
jgi:hypothetical protein